MSAFLGNLACHGGFGLRFRICYDVWVRRNKPILCLKGRDYSSSSVPVRYIPKKSAEVDEAGNSRPNKGFENRIFDKRLDGEAKTYVLGKEPQNVKQPAFSESDGEFNHDLDIEKHKHVDEENEAIEEIEIQHKKEVLKKNMQSGRTMQDAEKLAVGLLAARALTAVELRKKLLGKRFSPNIVEAVVSKFQSRGLINDGSYAEMFSQSRWSSLSWGPGRIKHALFKKGVTEADTEKALKVVFHDNESEDHESKAGLSKISMDHLVVQATKQWLRGENIPKETRKSRIVRWLQYRGFNWGVISFVLKKLESLPP